MRLALGLPIDINGATLEDLMLISGIGEKTAEKIIQLRQERGHFKRLEELMEVKGIKEKRFQQLKPYLSVAEERRGSE
jgi:competence protein ComEA